MNAIALSFTLKGQDERKIINQIERVAEDNPDSILIHGFLPRKMVEEKGWSTGILDALDACFPSQIKAWGPNLNWRDGMAAIASKLDATVIIIGEIKEGVQEEIDLYNKLGLTVVRYELVG